MDVLSAVNYWSTRYEEEQLCEDYHQDSLYEEMVEDLLDSLEPVER